MKKNKHGGKRKNQTGRKLIGESLQKRRTITISDDFAARARKIGDGNLSEGIRLSLTAYKN